MLKFAYAPAFGARIQAVGRNARLAFLVGVAAVAASGHGARAQEATYGPPSPRSLAEEAPAIVPSGIPNTLAQAADEALDHYPAIQAAESAVRASASELKAAKWMRFPSVSVEALSRFGTVDPLLQVDQPLWTGGRISGAIDRAAAARQVAIARLDETATDVALRLTSAYYEIARSIQLETILKESLAEHEKLVESMERRVAQEVSPRSDLELARSRAAQVRQEIAAVSAQRYAALQRFYELVGDPTFDLGPIPEYSKAQHHPPVDGAVTLALECNPAIRRMHAEAQVAKAEEKIAKASLLPQVGLQGGYSPESGTRFGLSVRAQTEGGLSGFASAEASRSRTQAAALQVDVAERETREAVVLDVVENTSSLGRIESGQAAADAAMNVTESFMRQFITGRRTWLDVMNAVRESNSARIGLTEAKVSAMASAARLRLRTCQWRPELGE